jgi:arylsulfatase A-like enzyme
MRKLLGIYLQLLQPSFCLVAYLWGLEFQSVYEPRYASLFDSLADCGAILLCALLLVAFAYMPVALLASRVFRNAIIYINKCGVKICVFLITYFYFRRWLDRWSVTDVTNNDLVVWAVAGIALLLVCWSLFRLIYASAGPGFAGPTFQDCFSFGVIPISFIAAIVLSIKVGSHLLAKTPLLLAQSAVSAAGDSKSQFRPNIILVTADALRAESTSLESRGKNTPFLEKLAAKSSVYSKMHTNAASTSAALTTILSGKRPLFHGNLTRKVHRYDSDENLFRVLKDSGYTTVAITGNTDAAAVVAAFGRFLSRPQFPELGSQLLARLRRLGIYPTVAGAAMYRDLYLMYGLVRTFTFNRPHGYANETFELAERILSEIPQPFFLFVHIHEPHEPYYVLSHVGAENSGHEELKVIGEISPPNLGYYPASNQLVVDGYRTHYDQSIRFLDFQLERFVSSLEHRGLWRNALFLFVADHGESFARGYLAHGEELYEDSTRVPLIIHFPSQTKGEKIEELVQSADVAPTILDAAGLRTPAWMNGQALKPGRAPESRDSIAVNYKQPNEGTYFSLPTMLAIWSGSYKLIISCKGDRIELYDLKKDPGEAVNLARKHSDVVKSLKQKLHRELAQQTAEPKLSCEFGDSSNG